jgi:hypothetical protein
MAKVFLWLKGLFAVMADKTREIMVDNVGAFL